MKKVFFVIACILSVPLLAQDLHVMTFNIRYNNARDSQNAWPYRKDNLTSQILFHDVHLLGVQEALHEQMVDLDQRLPSFNYIGVGRDDGKEKGEYSAIFFDTTRLNVMESGTFWLSQTPDVAGSKGWDAALPRIVTWGRFRDRQTKKIFFAFNTHFDHMGKEARRESAKLLLQKISTLSHNTPAILTGDFNSVPTDEPIQIITDNTNPLHLTDSKQMSATPHYGPTGTFNGFGQKERDAFPIDYIFLKSANWKVKKHATLSESWGGRFASDHFAVMAILKQ